jgi:DNA-binding SARP family transcriptional activator/TolB-like protein
MIRLQVLGSIDLVSTRGETVEAVLAQPKRAALLAYLAVATPRGFHRRDVITAMFWPEHDAEQSRHALRQALYFLRRAAGPGVIVSRGEELAVSSEQLACDVWEFEQALGERRHEDALAIYRGDLLPGFHISEAPEFERWLDAERARLRDRAAAAAWAAADEHERAADPAAAAKWARRAVGLVPGDETGLRRLLLCLERLGDRAAALRAYEAFVEELGREYELEPSRETRLLADRIRDTDPAAADVTAPPRLPIPDGAIVSVYRPVYGVESLPAPEDQRGTRVPEPAPAPGRRPWVARWWLAATAVLILIAVGVWWNLWQGGPGRERVIVADFSSAEHDSTIADLVAQQLRSELARSPMLIVVGRPAINATLQRMRVQPGLRLTPSLAREAAKREEVRIVVEGRAEVVGSGVALSAAIIEVASGDILFGATDTAYDRGNSRSLLQAISRLAHAIRRGAGESVAVASPADSLWSFTTPSTVALAGHMVGTRAFFRGDYLSAAAQFNEVLTIDPEFAHAHLLFAGMQWRAMLPVGPGLRAVERAYALRPNLTARERYVAEGSYHRQVEGDVHQAVEAFRRHIEAREKGEGVWYQSYAATLIAAGDLVRAREILEESLEVYSTADSRALYAAVLVAVGEDREAAKRLKTWLKDDPRHPALRRAHARLLVARSAWTEAHAEAERIRRETGLDNDLLTMAVIDALVGRVGEARSHLFVLREQALSLGAVPAALEISCAIDQLRRIAGEAPSTTEIEGVLRQYPITAIDTLSRPYLTLAMCFARAGRADHAREWLDAYEREFPQRFRGPERRMLHRARAALHLAEDQPEQAVRELTEAARTAPLRMGMFDDEFIAVSDHPELARAYDRLGAPDSAIAVYERYLAARSLNRSKIDAFELVSALERLAQLFEERGHRRRAATVLLRFAEQWREADADLRPRVLQARRRANALGRAPS